jgi:predicted DNA-binding protein with PD1-like motif
MKSKLLQDGPRKTWMIVFDRGEEASAGLMEFARKEKLGASQFTAIGAFSSVELGFFVIEKRDYERIAISEQVEVLSIVGDITEGEKGPKVHAHAVVGKRNASAWGGHLVKGIVNPTLEVVITESPTHLKRRHDDASGLSLIDPTLP